MLSIGGSINAVRSQADLIRFDALLDNRWMLGDVPDESRSLPAMQPVLRDSIAGPDALELAFAPWADLDSLENVVVQWMLGDGMANLQKLALLYDGFCLPLRSELEAAGLPVSMACLPLMLTACDPSYLGPGNRAGIWALPLAGNPPASCDRRHHLDDATAVALSKLMAYNEADEDDPLQVLWRFVRADKPDALSPHPQPLASKSFDEWITLYRVLVRFLENFERDDHRGTWLLEWSRHREVQCPGELNRTNLRHALGWDRRTQQTWIPWWRGEELSCDVWAACPVTLPAELASNWEEAFSHGVPSFDGVPFPEFVHRVAAGESLGGIARKYGVSVAEIVAMNDLANDGLQVDQTLLIPALQ